jgi:hypothetical protein
VEAFWIFNVWLFDVRLFALAGFRCQWALCVGQEHNKAWCKALLGEYGKV